MTDTENISEFYYQNLHKAKAPHILLSSFLCRLFDRKEKDTKYYSTMGKLVRLYGRERVFFCILDLYDMEDNLDWNRNIYPIMAYLIKKRLAKDSDGAISYEDLTDYVSSLKKKIKKQSVDIEEFEDAFDDE